MKKMILCIDTGEKLVEHILNKEALVNNRLDFSTETEIPLFYLACEIREDGFVLKSNDYIQLSENHNVILERSVSPGLCLKGKACHSGQDFTITVREIEERACYFQKFDISKINRFTVGSGEHCDLVLRNPYVSREHLVFQKQKNSWMVESRGRNGSFLNSERIKSQTEIRPGSCISVLGFKLYLLGNVLAVNNTAEISTGLATVKKENVVNRQVYGDSSHFTKAPRVMEPLDTEEIAIEQPPTKNKKRETPFIFVLGPTLTMPIPILTMVLFNIFVSAESGSSPITYIGMVLSVILFAVIGAIWAVARHRYDEKKDQEEEIERVNAYQKYIHDIRHLIKDKQKKNKNILERQYIASNQLLVDLMREPRFLWNRNVNHPDFLCVRIGTGSIFNPNHIAPPKERFSVVQDVLTPLPGQIQEKYALLKSVPKLLDLKNNKIVGLIGEPQKLQGILNNMILQVVMLHSYTDVQIALLEKSTGELYRLNWIRWLPHVFNIDKSLRFIADNEYSRELIISELTSEIRKRQQKIAEAPNKVFHFRRIIVFSTARAIMENQTIYRYLTDDADYGVTFVLTYGKMEDLPNECKILIENTDVHQGIYRLDEAVSDENAVQFEMTGVHRSEAFARKISGLHVSEVNESAIPDRVDYFDMLQVGDISKWDLLRHYRENRSYEGIRSYIGTGAGERPIYMDIHEKKFGPHGLIAGTTGSGKSELIQTFILSLALNYHPDEVAFILIDYKGGGMANVFTGMPHVAGTITNLGQSGEVQESLDENQTRRMLIAFRSEIKRRQKLFNRFKVSHIDQYMRLYRENKATEAMPHLIIVSDEFAELKKEQPEFIKELVSTARVGRSLGIHLILATQKPGGVVDDEIWANARFKLCLRVQDRQDSMGMLKRPEAAELTQTGRAYMQIGNDEIFEQFQTAYSGANYFPREELNSWHDEDFNMIEMDGRPALVRSAANADASAVSQLEAAVRHIIHTSEENAIFPARSLWMPPLADRVLLSEVPFDDDVLTATIGLIDDPENQAQYPFKIDFAQQNHVLIVGQPGCGKSVLVQTLVQSMVEQNLPSAFQFYCADYSTGFFRVYSELPHCGDVVLSEEDEKLERLFQLISRMIRERKELFSKLNVGSFVEIDQRRNQLPMIMIVIDGYFEMISSFTDAEDQLLRLLRDSARFGIQFVVTTTHISDMRYKVKQNFGMTIPMQMQERGDYMEALGQPPVLLPSRVKGRGLVPGKGTLEFQTLLAVEGKTELERRRNIQHWVEAYKSHYGGTGTVVKGIPQIPYGQGYKTYYQNNLSSFRQSLLPLGYTTDTIVPYGLDLRKAYCFSIGAAKADGMKACFQNLMYAAVQQRMPVHFIQVGTDMEDLRAEGVKYYRNYAQILELMKHLRAEFKKRSDAWKSYSRQDNRKNMYDFCSSSFVKEFVLIDDFGRFEQMLYEPGEEEAMDALVELFFKEGKGRGIYFAAGFPAGMDKSQYFMQAAKLFTGYDVGVYFGGRIDRQQLFAPDGISLREQMEVKPAHYGYAYSDGTVTTVWQPEKL